ncbi:outer membrane beta-barrel protein [Penaeicola halotolerans]|uniref:outer membrane beta-barrel protein n=1 Tax=Penaeicola halotolerans TaxID=2793196 RepID=UPI001CF89DFA|nr:outer membrane beta-barrel protein [Penaeicola halotolerans]
MKEPFDKKLSQKIKATYEALETPFNEAHWTAMQQKLAAKQQRKRRVAFIWWLSAASLTALFAAIGLRYFAEEQMPLSRPMATAVNPSSEQVIDSVEREGIDSATEAFTASSDQPNILQPTAIASRTVTNREIDQSSPHRVNEVTKERLLALFSWEPKIDFRDISSQLAAWVGDSFVERSKANKPEILLAQETEKTPEEAEAAAEEVIAKWLEEGDEPKEKKDKRPVKLGVMVAPQSVQNIAGGQANWNMSAGLASEVKLTKRLSADIGVVYAQQEMRLDPDDNMLRNALASEARFNTLDSRSAPSEISQVVAISGFDIPINLRYSIYQQENKRLYVSSGLSSLVYFEEKNKTTITNPVPVTSNVGLFSSQVSAAPAVFQEVEQVSDFDTFQPFQLINLSFGWEQKLKNGTSLTLEPYYKLPIGDMTNAQQRFGIGGLNLRFDLDLQRK